MENFKKKFCGTWKFDRTENLEEGTKAMGTPEEEIKFFASVKPTMVIDLEGDMVFHRTELSPGINDDLKYKFGEEFVNKDPNNDPPLYNNKILATLENGMVKYITRSLLTGPVKKDYQTNLTVNGDEMCSVNDFDNRVPLNESVLGALIASPFTLLSMKSLNQTKAAIEAIYTLKEIGKIGDRSIVAKTFYKRA